MADINKKQALILLGGLVTLLLIMDSQCYFANDACLPDFGFIMTAPNIVSDQSLLVKSLSHGQINQEWKEKLGAVYLIMTSEMLTGNYHTFSIISSAALLVVTYLFAFKITGNRLASVIGVVVLEFSKTFMWYSDSIAYPNFWLTLFMLSLYPFKKSYLRPIAFIGSFIMKAEALAFLPLTFLKENNWKNKLVYYVIAGVTIFVSVYLNWIRNYGSINTGNIIFPYVGFVLLSQDLWILILFAPITLILIKLWRKKTEWAGFLLGAMGYCLLFQYVLPIVSTYNAWSYRMLPFVVFFALSISLIITKLELIQRLQYLFKEHKILLG